MKTSREQLKALLKELLVEVLTEGLGPVQMQPRQAPRMGAGVPIPERRQLANGRQKPAFDPRLDTPIGARTPTDALKETIRREAGGNPIMADILADTAMTTLPSQLQSEPMAGGMPVAVQQEQFNGEPADVFGAGGQMRADGSSHWADLAFMGKKSA